MKHPARIAIVLWAAAAIVGMVVLWNYQTTSGRPPAVADRWPAAARLAPADRGLTLVMFAHPRCPCSRASVEELAKVMARCQGRVTARVLFLLPAGEEPGWAQTDLWRQASAIPGADAQPDVDGLEARRFGAVTSGHVLLYDAQGQLLFSGGITPGRGHEGDNAGREAVAAFAAGADPPGGPLT